MDRYFVPSSTTYGVLLITLIRGPEAKMPARQNTAQLTKASLYP